MPVSPARAQAFGILMAVEQTSAHSDHLLRARLSKLSAADRGLCTELVMGVLRWRSLLDARIEAASIQPLKRLDAEVLMALRLAAYQMGFLERVPARAAVHESVELVKRAHKSSAAGFVNAVLRRLAQAPAAEPDAAADAAGLAARYAHPEWMVERWIREYGPEAAAKICHYDQQAPETALRIRDAAAGDELEAEGIELALGRLLAGARRVVAGDVSRTKVFAGGRAAIQDEASQLVAMLVGKGANILDCCAAPGGKTLLLAEQNPEATIAAVELDGERAKHLGKRLENAGVKNVSVICADIVSMPFDTRFDRILCDVPCSGTGTLARNPEIKWRLKAEALAELKQRQIAILRSALNHLAPGGRLIYATCSLEREENEDVVDEALRDSRGLRLHDARKELEKLKTAGALLCQGADPLARGPYLRTLPGVHPCDGFFAAILEKD